jgi:hypothetical protein
VGFLIVGEINKKEERALAIRGEKKEKKLNFPHHLNI